MTQYDDYIRNTKPPKDNSKRNFLIGAGVAAAGSLVSSAAAEEINIAHIHGVKPTDAHTTEATIAGGAVAGAGVAAVLTQATSENVSRRDAALAISATGFSVLAGSKIGKMIGQSRMQEPINGLPQNGNPEIAPSVQARTEPVKVSQPQIKM